MMMVRCVFLALILFFATSVFAHSNSAKSINGITVKELDKDIGLTPGFGEQSVKTLDVQGSGKLANKLVRQAIGMMHCFHYIDAVRSVRQAIRIDADHIYAHIIGIFAYAHFGRDQSTIRFVNDNIDHLSQLQLTATESAWLNFAKSWSAQQKILDKKHGVQKSVAAAYRELVMAAGKSDLEVMSLASWLANIHDQTVYKEILKVDPQHVGAHHYLTHINEFTGDHSAALKYSKELAAVAPGSAHAQHMYGHILPLVGKWKEALVQFEKADKIHTDWAKTNAFPADYDWHYSHNNHLMSVVLVALQDFSTASKYLELGCRADVRACLSYSQMAVVAQDDGLLDKSLKLALKTYPEYSAFLKQSGSTNLMEIQFHQGKINSLDLKNTFSKLQNPGFVESLALKFIDIQLTAATDPKLAKKMTAKLWPEVKARIERQFSRGGFDSWATGLPNVLRVKNISKTLGLIEMTTLIEKKMADLLNL